MNGTARGMLAAGLVTMACVAVGLLGRSIWRLCERATINAEVRRGLLEWPLLKAVTMRRGYGEKEGVQFVWGCLRDADTQILLVTASRNCPGCDQTLTTTLAHASAHGAAVSIYVVGEPTPDVTDMATRACDRGQNVEVFRVRNPTAFRMHTGTSVVPTTFMGERSLLQCVITGQPSSDLLALCSVPSGRSVRFTRSPGAVQIGSVNDESN
ncbi:MAG: hypothetical protein AMXMBFR57_15950 [Acidimicrobiia bacterium]